MGNLGDLVPPGEDAELRQQRDTERRQQEDAAARRLERSQIGNGGVLKIDGTLQVTGDLEVPSGALSSAGSMTAGVDVLAGQDVSAVRDVLAGRHLNAVSDLGVGGTSTLNVINSLSTYSRNVTGSGSYRVMYVNINGEIGYVPSSMRFKTHVAEAEFDASAILAIRLVTYRYLAAVEQMGENAPVEWGAIAEELHDLGLTWLIDYDEDGLPFSLRQDRVWVALLAAIQHQDRRMLDLEKRISDLEQAQAQ